MVAIELVKPGEGLTLPATGETGLAKPKTLVETLLHLFPSNPVDAMARQDMLQIVIFATLLGIAAAQSDAKGDSVVQTQTPAPGTILGPDETVAVTTA